MDFLLVIFCKEISKDKERLDKVLRFLKYRGYYE